jgi:hypothetical protein
MRPMDYFFRLIFSFCSEFVLEEGEVFVTRAKPSNSIGLKYKWWDKNHLTDLLYGWKSLRFSAMAPSSHTAAMA